MTPIRSRWRAGALAVLSAPAMTVETITYPGLGGVTVCQPAGPPREFVIFASGDGGWNKGVARCLRLRRRKVRNVLAFRATEVRHEALRKPDPRRRFVARVPGAQVMMLPKVGHGYSVERNWLPQLLEAFHRISDASGTARSVLPAAVTDLPLVELHASGAGDDRFAIKLSGDGGWRGSTRRSRESSRPAAFRSSAGTRCATSGIPAPPTGPRATSTASYGTIHRHGASPVCCWSATRRERTRCRSCKSAAGGIAQARQADWRTTCPAGDRERTHGPGGVHPRQRRRRLAVPQYSQRGLPRRRTARRASLRW